MVGPDDVTGKTVTKPKKGFDQIDTEKLRELVMTASEVEHGNG
jgi:hypothetical protein